MNALHDIVDRESVAIIVALIVGVGTVLGLAIAVGLRTWGLA